MLIIVKVVLDPVETDEKRTVGEIEVALSSSLYAMNRIGWRICGVPLKYHKIADVIHYDEEKNAHNVCFVDGMRYILVPLTPTNVQSLSILEEMKDFEECSIAYITDLPPGANVLVDASDKHGPDVPAQFRRRLEKAVTERKLNVVHQSYPLEYLKMSSEGIASRGAFRSTGKGKDMVFHMYQDLSLNHGIKYAVIKKLPSKCGFDIPQRYRNSHGVDIGGRLNLSYTGNDPQAQLQKDITTELKELYRERTNITSESEGSLSDDIDEDESDRSEEESESSELNNKSDQSDEESKSSESKNDVIVLDDDSESSECNNDRIELDVDDGDESDLHPDSSSSYNEGDEVGSDSGEGDEEDTDSGEGSNNESSDESSTSSSEESSDEEEADACKAGSMVHHGSSAEHLQDSSAHDSDDSDGIIGLNHGPAIDNRVGEADPDVQLVNDLRQLPYHG